MRKRILSMILTLCMVLAMLPTAAFATDSGTITIDVDDEGVPTGDSNTAWSYDENKLTLKERNSFMINGTLDKSVTVYVYEKNTIEGGTFSGEVYNNGTIEGGTFFGPVKNNFMYGTIFIKDGIIEGGIFSGPVKNNYRIQGGTFSGTVENKFLIEGGTFSGTVINEQIIRGGTFSGKVENKGLIEGGTFSGTVINEQIIRGGTFSGTVENKAAIEGGTFSGEVENKDIINGGTFSGTVVNNKTINGGVFQQEPSVSLKGKKHKLTVTDGNVKPFDTDTAWVVGNAKVTIEATVPEGETFKEWTGIEGLKFTDSTSKTSKKATFTILETTGDVSLTATFKPTYTITLDVNGGNAMSPNTLTTDTNGKLASLPPTPTRSGNYRFDGWFTEESGGSQVTEDTVFTQNTTIYAHWTDTDAEEVAAAKEKTIDGSVNVAFGADQTAKTKAVQEYVNNIIKNTSDAAGVTATVSYNSGNGKYEVTISKGSIKETKSLTMTVNVAQDPDIATVNHAKTAVEGASYENMTQSVATSETIIGNTLKTAAESAVNDNSVTVSINKVSYTEPVAGTSANPSGTNGSYIFTVTVSKGSQSETTTLKSITITATAYSGGGGGSNGGGSSSGGSSNSSFSSSTDNTSGIKAEGTLYGDITVNPLTDTNTGIVGEVVDAETYNRLEVTVESGCTIIGAYEVKCSNYSGKLTLTFPVDTKYNGKDFVVKHRTNAGSISTYTGTVKDGKIVITVSQLSPFMIAIKAEHENLNTEVWNNPFIDVKESDWFYKSMVLAYEQGLMQGTSASTFEPNAKTTRGMIITILYNLAGKPDIKTDDTAWYVKGRAWAMEKGISDGTNIQGYITREQLVTMLWKNAGESKIVDYKGLNNFNDASRISGYAQQAFAWAHQKGIIQGKGNGILDPKGNATRAEVASMIINYLNAVEK